MYTVKIAQRLTQLCETAGHGLKWTKCPAVRNTHRIPTEILNQTLLKVFGVSFEMSSDPKKYFGSTFDEFGEYI